MSRVGPSSRRAWHSARAAESIGVPSELALRTQATVVDLLRGLAANRPADCGAGNRQLALKLDAGRRLLAATLPERSMAAKVRRP